jgi:hypothetical protein
MALVTRELYTAGMTVPVGKRILPTLIKPCEFGVGAGEVLVPGTLVAFNTSTVKWSPWQTGGANGTGTVKGILVDTVTLSAGGEVIGNVMLAGEIHRGDVVSQYAATSNQIDAALNTGVRDLGIYVQGLDDLR